MVKITILDSVKKYYPIFKEGDTEDVVMRKYGGKVLPWIQRDTRADTGRLAVDSGQTPITVFLPSAMFLDVSDARQLPCFR